MGFIKILVAAILDFFQGIVVVLAVMVMVYLFLMSPQEINGQSMDPMFHNGEYILTNKVEYKLTDPSRGDIVIFKSPRNKSIDYIKRIIGLPGEQVEIRDGHYYINGKMLNETAYLSKDVITYGGQFLKENEPYVVPQNMYFVSGDNRMHSSDSREFGPVAKEDFIGKAMFRYWPFSRTGVIPKPTYFN